MPGSRFYTRRGDEGYTSLLGPERVLKYDPRPEAYGTVDEAQAVLGVVRASGCASRTREVLLAIQRDLYILMSELAASGEAGSPFVDCVMAAHVDQLEMWIAEFEAQVEMPREFVIPGDSQAGAALHLARTVVRRAERHAVRLSHEGMLRNELVVPYLNRLSSLLFVLALFEDGVAAGRDITLAKE
jgi:cob(I)alamin adenosyltransferase